MAEQFAKWGAALPEQFRDDYALWPELLPVAEVFATVSGQWRATQGVVYALDLTAVYPLLDRRFKCEADWEQALADIRVMGRAGVDYFLED